MFARGDCAGIFFTNAKAERRSCRCLQSTNQHAKSTRSSMNPARWASNNNHEIEEVNALKLEHPHVELVAHALLDYIE